MVQNKGPCPDAATSGFFNKLMFRWINPVVKQAAKTGEVDLHHLPLPTDQTAEVAYDVFVKDWEAAVRAGNPNLRKALWKTFGKSLMIAGIFKLIWSIWCVWRNLPQLLCAVQQRSHSRTANLCSLYACTCTPGGTAPIAAACLARLWKERASGRSAPLEGPNPCVPPAGCPCAPLKP